MSKPFSVAVLVFGIMLAGFGIKAANSFDSGLSPLVRALSMDRAIWLLISGVLAIFLGGFGLTRDRLN